MARRGRAADLQAAKQRKQKRLAIVGGVLLLGALAFSVPKTMSMMSGGTNLPEEETTAVATTPAAPAETPVSLEPPSLGGTPAAAAAPAGGEAPVDGSEPAPLASAGQLVSFSRFESKDPFSPQVLDAPTGSPTPPNPGGGAKPPGGAEVPGVPSTPVAAVISVDGAKETVAPGNDFPAASPLFRLVSLTKSHAAIAIAGGSLADGAQTVKLVPGEPLTLMNTADGVRYELRLVSFIRGSAPAS